MMRLLPAAVGSLLRTIASAQHPPSHNCRRPHDRPPVFILLSATIAVGLTLGLFYLRRQRKPGLNALHLLLGAGALETLAVLLHGAPNGDVLPTRPLGGVVLALLALSMFSGLIGPLFRKRAPRASERVLIAHAGIGLTVFVVFLIWSTGR